MKFAALQKNSFVDYPGKIAAVVFTRGCNFNCYYCHNRTLLDKSRVDAEAVSDDEVLTYLKSRKDFLEGLVVTGGEPTLHSALFEFLQRVKSIGYAVKFDTNGSNPEVLKRLIKCRYVDYFAMDFKAPFGRYSEICGVDVNADCISDSVQSIMKSGIDYEFRTTFVPQLSIEDISQIADEIKGARLYAIQQYRKDNTAVGVCDPRLLQKPHTGDYVRKAVECAKGKVCKCITRGI